jgi:hypothetical protein
MKKIICDPLFGLCIAFVIISFYVITSQKRWNENANSLENICSNATKQTAEANAFGQPVVITETDKLEENKIRFIYHFVRGNRQNLIAVCKVNKGKPEVDLVSIRTMLGG